MAEEESDQVGQDDIERLLKQAQETGGAENVPPPTPPPADGASVDQSEIEALLSGAVPSAGATPPPADGASVDQSEIEALLSKTAQPASQEPAPPASQAPPPPPASPAPAPPTSPAPAPPATQAPPASPAPAPPAAAPVSATAKAVDVSKTDIELLLNKAEEALASIDQEGGQPAGAMPPGARNFEFQKFSGTSANTDSTTLELMSDVQLDMTIELGRTHMHLEDLLQLKQGAVVPLDKMAGDPADIFVNGRLVARGEVLVLNDNFCVRVAELVVGESACA